MDDDRDDQTPNTLDDARQRTIREYALRVADGIFAESRDQPITKEIVERAARRVTIRQAAELADAYNHRFLGWQLRRFLRKL